MTVSLVADDKLNLRQTPLDFKGEALKRALSDVEADALREYGRPQVQPISSIDVHLRVALAVTHVSNAGHEYPRCMSAQAANIVDLAAYKLRRQEMAHRVSTDVASAPYVWMPVWVPIVFYYPSFVGSHTSIDG